MGKNGYPRTVREPLVRRMLSAEPPSLVQLSEESGVGLSTLFRWKQQALRENWMEKERSTMATRPNDRSPEQKLALVIAAEALADEELGAFLRREGIHEAQLQQWRREALNGLGGSGSVKSTKPSRRIRSLERELARKEKALAEAAALLLLKKRAQQLLGGGDESTE
jgi:transposase-like protein